MSCFILERLIGDADRVAVAVVAGQRRVASEIWVTVDHLAGGEVEIRWRVPIRSWCAGLLLTGRSLVMQPARIDRPVTGTQWTP